MKKADNIKIVFILTFVLSTFLFSQPAQKLKNDSYTYLKSNLEFLASDELEGREITTRGEKLAALYISEELEKYGVLPFGDNGTYFQEFLVEVSGFNENSKISFVSNNEDPISFFNGNNIVFNPRLIPTIDYNNKEYEVIFVGYGIFSEEENYNSYEGIDVDGKVVLFLNGTPKINGREVLADSTIRRYRRSSEKSKLAYSKGAVGALILPNSETLKYWKYFQSWTNNKSFKLIDEFDTIKSNNNIATVLLDEMAAQKLLDGDEQNYEVLNNLVDPKPEHFILKRKVKFEYDALLENRKARNVIGMIEGTNKKLKNEYISIGAHYDHEGIKNGEIYNGADDNGSGTVTILEVARTLALFKENERPVIVMFHTGEEKGLLGSKYLSNNSNFINDIIVHINIDMVGRRSEDSIFCIGASKISSELGKIVEAANSESANFVLDYKFDDPKDPQRLYYRSDHINYARKGIPIVFFYDYMKQDYHKPTDTVDKINYKKMIKIKELIYTLTKRISNQEYKLTIDK